MLMNSVDFRGVISINDWGSSQSALWNETRGRSPRPEGTIAGWGGGQQDPPYQLGGLA